MRQFLASVSWMNESTERRTRLHSISLCNCESVFWTLDRCMASGCSLMSVNGILGKSNTNNVVPESTMTHSFLTHSELQDRVRCMDLKRIPIALRSAISRLQTPYVKKKYSSRLSSLVALSAWNIFVRFQAWGDRYGGWDSRCAKSSNVLVQWSIFGQDASTLDESNTFSG